MLGRDPVDDRRGVGRKIAHENDAAVVAPARARDVGAHKALELGLDRRGNGIGKGFVVGNQHRLRGRIVLGLRQQIGRDPGGIVLVVGDDQDFRRAGNQIDADLAEHAALGGGDVGVAGTGDLVDGLDRRRAIGECCHRLRAADTPDLVGAGDLGGQHDQRIDHAVRRRHDHDHPLHARHLGRHDVHQHRRGIGRRAAGHIDAHRLERPVARAEPRAGRVREVDVLGQQRAMEGLDAPRREDQRLALGRGHPGGGGFAFGIGDAQARDVGVEAIELPGVVEQRRIATSAHVCHDVGHDAVDILVGIPVAPEEGRKFLFESRRRSVEPKRQWRARESDRPNRRSARPAS